jgi:predicted dehydrogenase
MKTTKTFKGAIIGCGYIANICHIPAWESLKDQGFEITSICDPNAEALKDTVKRWGHRQVYPDIDSVLNKGLDFVDICVNPQLHRQLAVKAMRAGLHVLIEKPMAVNLKEAQEMAAVAQQNKVKLGVVHNLLFSPVLQKATALVRSGAVGELRSVEVRLMQKYKPVFWHHDLPGEGFGEYAPHAVYLIGSFLGKVRSVQAISRKNGSGNDLNPGELRVSLEAEKGMGSFHISFNSYHDSISIGLFGTRSDIHVDYNRQVIFQSRPHRENLAGMISERLDLTLPVFKAATSGIASRFKRIRPTRVGHLKIIQDFAESLRTGSDPAVCGEDGVENLRVLQEIWRQTGNKAIC